MSLADPHWHNPDVLSCIANLSNDEVFTPPHIAKSMMDEVEKAWAAEHNGENIWANPNVKFLDPFTKTGVFLREITSRLSKGLLPVIPDRQERINHILTQQVFGIGITRLTAMIARRSVYCSKFANGTQSVCTEFENEAGNIWFEPVHHTWQGTEKQKKAKKRTCRYCGAAESEYSRSKDLETHAYAFIHADNIQHRLEQIFGENMHFDVVIGNPPYQLSDGGHGASASPIYQLFVEQAMAMDPKYVTMIIPSRWFTGGKGLGDFRQRMLEDSRFRSIHDYWLVGDAFPGVDLQGGVNFFLWDRDYSGDTEVVSYFNGEEYSRAWRSFHAPGLDIFIRYNEAMSILKKVIAKMTGEEVTEFLLPSTASFASSVSSSKPFGIRTNHPVSDDEIPNAYRTYWNGGSGYKQIGYGWVAKTDITTGFDLIDKWKVFIGAAYGDRGGGGNSRDTPPKAVLGKPFIGEPGEISTETYNCIGPFDSQEEAQNVRQFIACKMTRFLVMLRKASQHATQQVYEFVPRMDFAEEWTDAKLYDYFDLSQSEIDFIEWMIRPMEDDSDE